MARKTLRARRFFSLIFPFFLFITSLFTLSKRLNPQKPLLLLKRKMKRSRLNTPTNISHGKRRQEQSAREDALAGPRLW